jgi:aryl-alcohol dehydrogenase-like predicted oxidoreductase
MNYLPFGRTGLKVSPLAPGCMMFGGKTTPQDSYEADFSPHQHRW